MSSWSMAFRSLRRRRLRTVFTVSGIVVGVSMILVLLSLAAGTSAQTNPLVRALGGADIIVVNSTSQSGGNGPGEGGGFRAAFITTDTLNQSLIQTVNSIPGVYAVSPQLSFAGYLDGRFAFISGIDPATYSKATGGLNIVSGSSITAAPDDQIVVGRGLASSLGLGPGSSVALGMNSTTTGGNFTVVGISESGTPFQDNAAYIPITIAQTLAAREGRITQILVKAQDPNQINGLSTTITSDIPGIRTVTASSFAQAASQLTNTLTTFFTVIGLVALMAGGFGVVNTMFMSVGERTKEIGTLKAIGAKKSDILRTFLTEAFLIGVLGGLVGVVIGTTASLIVPAITGSLSGTTGFGPRGGGFFRGALSPVITPYNLVLSFGLGALVGTLAGLYPAWRAARMDPVEALRHV